MRERPIPHLGKDSEVLEIKHPVQLGNQFGNCPSSRTDLIGQVLRLGVPGGSELGQVTGVNDEVSGVIAGVIADSKSRGDGGSPWVIVRRDKPELIL